MAAGPSPRIRGWTGCRCTTRRPVWPPCGSRWARPVPPLLVSLWARGAMGDRTVAAVSSTCSRARPWAAGSSVSIEARVAPAEGIAFASVVTGKIRRSSNPLKMASPANVRDMARVPLGVARARKIVADFGPDVVLATGGYVAVPAGLAARLCRRPLVLHEQTVRLGLANRKLAGSATRIAVSSESSLPLLPESVRSAASPATRSARRCWPVRQSRRWSCAASTGICRPWSLAGPRGPSRSTMSSGTHCRGCWATRT